MPKTLPQPDLNAGIEPDGRAIRREVARYRAPDPIRSLAQSSITIGGYLCACAAMFVLVEYSYWLALALAPLAAGLLVRVFIVQHDCGHGSYFASKHLNDALGLACSLLTLAPYASWRRQHDGHHTVWNNLDRRDSGADIYSSCLTVDEYRSTGAWPRFWYRACRHPLVANLAIPPLIFLVLYRLPFDMPANWRRERLAVYLTDLMLVPIIGGLGWALGFGRLAEVQLPVIVIASIIGVWLFSIQHRSASTIWTQDRDWDSARAALHGATYLRLPPILQWFTGNIGFHHIHHLNPKVPNYRLQECHEGVGALSRVPALSFRDGLKAPLFTLWDEQRKCMTTFRAAASRHHSSSNPPINRRAFP